MLLASIIPPCASGPLVCITWYAAVLWLGYGQAHCVFHLPLLAVVIAVGVYFDRLKKWNNKYFYL